MGAWKVTVGSIGALPSSRTSLKKVCESMLVDELLACVTVFFNSIKTKSQQKQAQAKSKEKRNVLRPRAF